MKIKKWIVLFLSLVLLAGCGGTQSKEEKTSLSETIIKQLDLSLTYEDVLEDISEVDFFHQPDYKEEYRKEVKKDDESSTSQELYYDQDQLIYVKYIGYGEDSVDYHTQSKSGQDIIVQYINQDEKRVAVSIQSKDYSFFTNHLNKDANNHMDSYQITLLKDHKQDMNEYASYLYDQDKKVVYLNHAQYYDQDGQFHNYTCDMYEGKLDEYDDIIYQKKENVEVSQEFLDMMNHSSYHHILFLVGNQHLSYTNDQSKQWYVTGQFSLFFNNQAQAKKVANEYKKELSVNDEGQYYIELTDVTVKVSHDFHFKDHDFYTFAQEEVNDYYYVTAKFNNDELTELTHDYTMSYY